MAGGAEASRRRRQRSVSSTSLNVNTWKPATLSPVEHRPEAVDERVGAEAAAQEAAREAAVLPQEAQRVADPDPRGHAQELRAAHGSGDADVDREPRPARPDVLDPLRGHGRVEADLARDVRRVPGLLEHRCDRRLVVDERMALRVAGDPHLGERATELVERLEQVDRAVEAPARLLGVARHDEHVPYGHRLQACRRSPRAPPRPRRGGRRGAARPRTRGG